MDQVGSHTNSLCLWSRMLLLVIVLLTGSCSSDPLQSRAQNARAVIRGDALLTCKHSSLINANQQLFKSLKKAVTMMGGNGADSTLRNSLDLALSLDTTQNGKDWKAGWRALLGSNMESVEFLTDTAKSFEPHVIELVRRRCFERAARVDLDTTKSFYRLKDTLRLTVERQYLDTMIGERWTTETVRYYEDSTGSKGVDSTKNERRKAAAHYELLEQAADHLTVYSHGLEVLVHTYEEDYPKAHRTCLVQQLRVVNLVALENNGFLTTCP